MSRNDANKKSFECKPLSTTGKKRFSVIRGVSRDSSQSLLLGHACQATAAWQFSVLIWKKGKQGENTICTPGLGMPCPSWVTLALSTWMQENILCQTVEGNMK